MARKAVFTIKTGSKKRHRRRVFLGHGSPLDEIEHWLGLGKARRIKLGRRRWW